MNGHGGKREGAGWPKGKKWGSTLRKEAARELARQKITRNLEPLIEAQIDNALGLKHLMMRDPKTGKFERVSGDAKQIDRALKSKNACWIYSKDPNVQSFTDLMNRAIDKPSEHLHIAGSDGGPILIQWMTGEDEPKPIEEGFIEIEAEHVEESDSDGNAK